MDDPSSQRGTKHTIIAIGYVGGFVCYLDVPMEEAKRRYAERDEWPSLEEAEIEVVTFEDVFGAYSIRDPGEM